MAGAGVPRGPIPPMPGMGPMSPIAGAMGVPGGYSEALRYQPDWFYDDAIVNDSLYTTPRESILFSNAKPLSELYSDSRELEKATAVISKRRYAFSKLLKSYTQTVRENYAKYLIIEYVKNQRGGVTGRFGDTLTVNLNGLTAEEIQRKVTYDLCKVGNISDVTSNPNLMSIDSAELALDGRLSDSEKYYDKEEELKEISKFLKKVKRKNSGEYLNKISTSIKSDLDRCYTHLMKNIYHNINVYNVFLGDLDNQVYDVNSSPMIEGMLPDSMDELDLRRLDEVKKEQEKKQKKDLNELVKSAVENVMRKGAITAFDGQSISLVDLTQSYAASKTTGEYRVFGRSYSAQDFINRYFAAVAIAVNLYLSEKATYTNGTAGELSKKDKELIERLLNEDALTPNLTNYQSLDFVSEYVSKSCEPVFEKLVMDNLEQLVLKYNNMRQQNQNNVSPRPISTSNVTDANVVEPQEENEVVQAVPVNTNAQPQNTSQSSENLDEDFVSLSDFLNGSTSRNSNNPPVDSIQPEDDMSEAIREEPVRTEENIPQTQVKQPKGRNFGKVVLKQEDIDFWNDLIENYFEIQKGYSTDNGVIVSGEPVAKTHDEQIDEMLSTSDEEKKAIDFFSNLEEDVVDLTPGKGRIR